MAVSGDREDAESRRAILREFIGIEKKFGRIVGSFLQVDYVLVLQAVIFREDVGIAPAIGRRKFRIVEKLLETLLDLGAIRNFCEIGIGDVVFGFDPGGGLGGIVIFEPAIGISNFGSVVVVDLFAFTGVGIGHGLSRCEKRENGQAQARQESGARRKQGFSHRGVAFLLKWTANRKMSGSKNGSGADDGRVREESSQLDLRCIRGLVVDVTAMRVGTAFNLFVIKSCQEAGREFCLLFSTRSLLSSRRYSHVKDIFE